MRAHLGGWYNVPMRDSSRHLFSRATYAGLAITTLLLLFPIVSLNAQGLSAESSAQTGDLRATIETSLRSDPSSVSLSQEEFEQLVDALVEVAEKQGVSAEDITWQPEEPAFGEEGAVDVSNSCGRVPAVLCALNEVFGFSGGSFVPLLLLFSSAALLLVLWAMLKMHHKHPQEVIPTPSEAESTSRIE